MEILDGQFRWVFKSIPLRREIGPEDENMRFGGMWRDSEAICVLRINITYLEGIMSQTKINTVLTKICIVRSGI